VVFDLTVHAYMGEFLAAGMRGYALQQCLKQERKRREEEEGGQEQQQQRLKYEQPGELVTLPSGETHGSGGDARCS
jgi:hypothetical protein